MAELDQDENSNLETRGFSEFKKKKKKWLKMYANGLIKHNYILRTRSEIFFPKDLPYV